MLRPSRTSMATMTGTAATILLALSTPLLLGAGFQLHERSASGLGRAFSGEAAIADDATVISSNPAGMIVLDDGALSIGLQWIRPDLDVNGTSAALAPASDSNVVKEVVVPYFFYSRKINDNLSAGLGIFSSFGLSTDYSRSFAANVGTETSEITTITINPSLAYRINDQFTIGAGVDVMYVEGKLTSLNTATDSIPGPVGSLLFSLEGDDWATGWNVGFLYEINQHTRIGLHYRSSVDLNVEGDAKGALVGGVRRDTSLAVELPDSIELSAYHQFHSPWAVHGDIIWTNWSRFKQLAPKVGIPDADAALFTPENWQDTLRYAIGTTYTYSDRITFRAGIALDESPVTTQHRTLRIPDGDRFWVSVGLTIKLNDCYNLDIGYTHVFTNDYEIQFSARGGNEGQFAGKVSGDVDLLGIGVSGSF